MKKQFDIIGGGISGLSAALRLAAQQPEAQITVWEKSDRCGGILQSTYADGYVIEHAADSFIVSREMPWAGELCDQLNLELIETSSTRRGASILRGGRLHPVPDGLHLMSIHRFGALLGSPLLSWSGKARVLAERFVPPKDNSAEESLGQFARRRFGTEMFERIVQPLVSGIYTADPEKLSMEAALPQFVKQELEYGSLIRAAMKTASNKNERGARYRLFRSPRDGMQSLVSSLESKLKDLGVRFNMASVVRQLRRDQDQWSIESENRPTQKSDGIVLATPMSAVPCLLGELSAQLSSNAAQIEHVSTAIVCLGYHEHQLQRPLKTFGTVIPQIEGRKILAVSHTNVKFPSRAPVGQVLLRVFVGGALQPEFATKPDEELLPMVQRELAEIMGVTGQPLLHRVIRWPKTTPQYHLGHRARVQAIRDSVAKLPSLSIANNAMGGVGVPQCIRAGWEAADSITKSCDATSVAK